MVIHRLAFAEELGWEAFVEDDAVFEQFTPKVANDPIGIRVLPGRALPISGEK